MCVFSEGQEGDARFKVHGKIVVRAPYACGLDGKSLFRYACVWVSEFKWFDRVVILAIVKRLDKWEAE